ncbi:uncharacterized protein A4U43_C07F2770 [Asparagus officinalis]|uniref:Kinesin-like protein n=1 Tax=Asparagus officinalis TaxID=4686 RepID=A0A5P1EC04_ASPOF|nr:uncharacterized protein A4U43_C07F2770 [Asparagus officinalis]
MSLTPNPSRKLGFSLAPSPSPFWTVRSEKRSADLRWADGGSSANGRAMKRIERPAFRPLSDEENRVNVQKVLSCNEQRKEVVVLLNKQAEKTFTFDKVFGPKALQRSIYDHAVSPIVKDVLEGFNCTVFAYGQTGTGKTYTMEGGMNSKGGELSVEAGVIPRAIHHIFDTLEARKADYSVKVTFLELYNEEIIDLFALEDHNRYVEDKMKKPISLMEDGKGGAVIRGLVEEVVYSANEIYNLLQRGSAKRRTADTILNKQSSRSHSVFSITINVKEAIIGNDELIKCGRLNLVDLAGSENISRSGARESQVREAGEVNKSLLTLGRVVTALVEHSGHIPYRDSKLTRLLRESLGGKAKTCIIATVSPSRHCVEETLSTLEFACRAKSIKNKPEVNQKLSKSVLLKDLYLQIEKIKQDVRAAREKNGVYIPYERFAQDETEKKAMSDRLSELELDLDLQIKEASKYKELYHAEQERNLDVESELKDCKTSLENSKKAFLDLQEVQAKTAVVLKEKEFIISNLLHSENAIFEQVKEIHSSLENASEDVSLLLTKIERQANTETGNKGLIMSFGSQLDQSLKSLHKTVIGSVCEQHQILRSMGEHVSSFIAKKCEFLATAISEAKQVLDDLQRSLADQKELLAFSAQRQEEGLQRSLVSTQAISKITLDFFNDLQSQASKLIAVAEENQMQKSCQLDYFENKFKELSAKEEKVALEKIAAILTNLTATKSSLVEEAVRSMTNMSLHEKKMLHEEMSNIHIISDKAKIEWNTHIKRLGRQFQEDASSATEARVTMENILHTCSEKVYQSAEHLENAELSIDQLNKDYAAEIESSVETRHQKSINLVGELMSTLTDMKFQTATHDMLRIAKDALSVDHEATREIGSISAMCSGHLQTLQSDHTENVKDIRSLAERCLVKEYLVDHPTTRTPVKQIDIPSLASIEALRTHSIDELVKEMRSENRIRRGELEGKQPFSVPSQLPRNPLTPINFG